MAKKKVGFGFAKSKKASGVLGVPFGAFGGQGNTISTAYQSYANLAAFPVEGEENIFYIADDTDFIYVWSGTSYVETSGTLALGETSLTAYRGDRGKTAYDHSQLVSGNPHVVTKAEVGLGSADNTSDVDKPVSTAQATAIGLRLLATNNLSDLNDAPTARDNLGLKDVTNTIYVDKAGHDTNGDGSSYFPYLTIAKALSVITTNSSSNQFLIDLGIGTWTEDITLKNYVFFRGESKSVYTFIDNLTRIVGNVIGLSTTGNPIHSGFTSCCFTDNTKSLDLTGFDGTDFTVCEFTNCRFDDIGTNIDTNSVVIFNDCMIEKIGFNGINATNSSFVGIKSSIIDEDTLINIDATSTFTHIASIFNRANATITGTEIRDLLADKLGFDNTTSGLTAVDIQSAIDEIVAETQPIDPTLSALAALTIAADSLTIGTGADAFSQTTFGINTFPAKGSTGALEAKTISDAAFGVIDKPTPSAMLGELGGVPTIRTINGQDLSANRTFTQDDIGDGATYKQFSATEETKLSNISVTQPVDLDAIETRVNELDQSVVIVGVWDASVGTFPGGGTAQAGHAYIVSVGGTVDSVDFVIGDRVIAILDNASTTTFAANWFHEDYTDKVSSVAGRVGNVVIVAADLADFVSAVIASAITGFSAGAGTVAATDTILQAFNKIVGNIDATVHKAGAETVTGLKKFDVAGDNSDIQIGDRISFFSGSDGFVNYMFNIERVAGVWKYIADGFGMLYQFDSSSGGYVVYTAPSGTAGATATLTAKQSSDTNGALNLLDSGGFSSVKDGAAISMTNKTGGSGAAKALWYQFKDSVGNEKAYLGFGDDTHIFRIVNSNAAGTMEVYNASVLVMSVSNTGVVSMPFGITSTRITDRSPAITQAAEPAINTDVTDYAEITGLAQAITSMTTNLTGTPVKGDKLVISFTDDGTARAIAWGAKFEASGNQALPTTTVISEKMDVAFRWNTVTSKWRCMGVS